MSIACIWLVAANLLQFANAQGEAPLTYRRIFVPAEKVESWPTEGRKFLPIESRDFDRWIKAANESAAETGRRAVITSAEYSAKLEGDRLVGGRGEWTIELQGEAPAFLPLGATSIVVRDSHWRDSPQRTVRMGTWGPSGGLATTQGLEVGQSGVLEFDWRAQSNATHHGVEVPWQLPVANRTRLVLELPDGQEPQIDGGILLAAELLPIESSDYAVRRRRWVLQVDSSKGAVLRIQDPRASQKADIEGLSLRDETQYHITHRGAEITSTWQLNATATLPDELAIPLPANVELIAVEADGNGMTWRIAQDAGDNVRRAVLKLPEFGANERPMITLRAWHPRVVDGTWRLPKLRPEGVAWTSGDLELTVAADLELHELTPTGCIETAVENLAGEGSLSETWRLAAYAANAELGVSLARRPADAVVRLGSSLAVADPDITGRLVTEWNVARGSIQKLSGELAKDWIVESVETIPGDALGEWFVDERSGRRSIEVQLAGSVTPSSKISVIISGRLRRSAFSDRLSAEAMRMVRWQGARVAEHDLTFQATESYAVEPFGELPRIAIDELGDDRRTLLGSDLLENSVFDLASAGRNAGLRFIARRGQFTADIAMDLTLARQEQRQDFKLSIEPTSNRIDRLLIFATEPLADDARWTDASDSAISAQRLPKDDPLMSGMPVGGELWRIELIEPTSRAFEILVTNTAADSGQERLPLLALPEAIQQQGRVLVRGEMAVVAGLETRGMLAAVPPLPSVNEDPAKEQAPVRAAYRFDPAKCLDAAQPPQLRITPAQASDASPIVAERVTIESFYTQDGSASHELTYRLQKEGDAPIELCLPEGAEIQTATVDGRSVSPGKNSDDRCIQIPLPAQMKSATVKVSFAVTGKPLSLGAKLEAPIVHSKIPLLAGEWNVRLPAEYSISESGNFNWRQRLFGPLGRVDGERPFQPLRPAEWIRLVNSISGLGNGPNSAAAPLAGWREYQKSFVADVPAAVYVAHPPFVNSWSVSIFLLCLVASSLIRRQGRAIFLLLLAAAAGLAIALPSVIAPLATGALIGLALSMFAGRPRRDSSAEGTSWRTNVLSTVCVLTFAVAVGLASQSLGQPAELAVEAKPSAAADTIHRVLIPMDKDGRRAGTKYFVSEEFLRELLRFDAPPASSGGEWLLTDVGYVGELRQGVEQLSVVAGDWSISCELEVLPRDTTVVLPLVRSEAAWPVSALVDGAPAPIVWSETGDRCAITIAEPGQHTVVIACTPTIADANGDRVLTLTIPQNRGAMLKLNCPADFEGLTVSDEPIERAVGESGTTEYKLDGKQYLTLRWPALDTVASGPRRVQVTELQWLHIGDNEVVADTKYILEGGSDPPDELTIAYDRDWELDEEQAETVEQLPPAETTGRAAIRISLAADEAATREVTLRWRHVDSRRLGRLPVPAIELVGLPVTQRWRAVSSAPSLECEASADAAQPATASEFLAVWGNVTTDETPQSALKTPGRSGQWSVEVLPLLSESEISQSVHVAVGSTAMRVVYHADVLPGNLHRFQFSLTAAPKLNIDEVAVSQAGRRIPVRWARAGADRVNVFFSEEMAGAFVLTLRGTVGPESGGVYRLHKVSVAVANAGDASVYLYREEDVMVTAHGLPEAELTESSLSAVPVGWRARHMGSYRLDPNAADKVRIEVQANNVKLAGDTLTSLFMVQDSWFAGFLCEVAVEQGTLDTLRLRVPPTWRGPFTIDSSAAASIEPPSGDATLVSIRFAEPIAVGGRLRLDIRAPLESATMPVAAPVIRPVPRIRGARYLSVPGSTEGRALLWNEVGVKQAQLPAALVLAGTRPTLERSFEVVGRPFGLTLMPPASTPHAARIPVTDTVASSDEQGRQVIATRFVVEPQGVETCELRLPGDQQLVEVRLDGRSAILRRAGETKWRVQLGPPQLPCVLEVISRLSEASDLAARREILRPALAAAGVEIPVDLSLWSFGAPPGTARPSIATTAGVTAAEQAVLRFERLLGIAETATATAIESTPPDGSSWLHTWAASLTRLRQDAHDLHAAPTNRQVASQIATPPDERLAEASARLDQWLEQAREALPEGEAIDQLEGPSGGEMLARPTADQSTAQRIYCVTAGGLDRLTLDSPTAAATQMRSQYLGVAAVVCACGACLILLRLPTARDVIYRWPNAVGFIAGLAYWAWMRPSWLGLVIAGGSLLLAWRSGWPGRAIRMEGSTVLRATRPK